MLGDVLGSEGWRKSRQKRRLIGKLEAAAISWPAKLVSQAVDMTIDMRCAAYSSGMNMSVYSNLGRHHRKKPSYWKSIPDLDVQSEES